MNLRLIHFSRLKPTRFAVGLCTLTILLIAAVVFYSSALRSATASAQTEASQTQAGETGCCGGEDEADQKPHLLHRVTAHILAQDMAAVQLSRKEATLP